MRRRLGNAVEPATLVRRFGADALRLGYLLSLQSGDSEVATASESHLRRARATIQRLNSKFSGLYHRTRAAAGSTGATDPSDLDRWLLGRFVQKVEAAKQAYDDERLDRVARRFAEAADDLSRFARSVVQRLDALEESEDEDGSHGAQIALRRTLASALGILAGGFEPVAPYLFDQLGRFVSRRSEGWEVLPEVDGDLGDRPPTP